MTWLELPQRYRDLAEQHLTERQRDVVQRICDGQTVREIALALEVAPATVQVHRERAFQKLAIALRQQEAA